MQFTKIRPIYSSTTPISWLNSKYISDFNIMSINNSPEKINFEFQDIRSGKVTKSKDYLIWKYSDIYSNYVKEINSNLEVIYN